jgi:hypothetical protein
VLSCAASVHVTLSVPVQDSQAHTMVMMASLSFSRRARWASTARRRSMLATVSPVTWTHAGPRHQPPPLGLQRAEPPDELNMCRTAAGGPVPHSLPPGTGQDGCGGIS